MFLDQLSNRMSGQCLPLFLLHKKWSFLLRISSVNVTKEERKKSLMEDFIFCAVFDTAKIASRISIAIEAKVNIDLKWYKQCTKNEVYGRNP